MAAAAEAAAAVAGRIGVAGVRAGVVVVRAGGGGLCDAVRTAVVGMERKGAGRVVFELVVDAYSW